MVTLKYQCLNCNEEFDFEVGNARFTSRHRLREEIKPYCPKCINKKLKIISSPEFDRLYVEFNNKYTKRSTIQSYKPGKMIAYNKIFGSLKKITYSFNGKNYEVVDSYCVNPFCECTDVFLNFYEITDPVIGNRKYPLFAFLVDYSTGIIRETLDVSESRAYEIYTGFNENLFKNRHEELKSETRPLILKKFKNKFVPTRKLGRNELCHCGSGKKYKKCCLVNDINKFGGRVRVKDEIIT
jgi:hypothetical protein